MPNAECRSRDHVAVRDTWLPTVAPSRRWLPSPGSEIDHALPACWLFLAVMPFLLMAAPAWATALGWEMQRFRAPAIPYLAIFAVAGIALVFEKLHASRARQAAGHVPAGELRTP